MIHYIDKELVYLARKPYGMPTTWGNQFSFLDAVEYDKPAFFPAVEKFGKEDEYGLLNRLDNDTEWFVYFAKTMADKEKYLQLQDEWTMSKIYLCAVSGDMNRSVKVQNSHVSMRQLHTLKINNTDIYEFLTDTFQQEYIKNAVSWFDIQQLADTKAYNLISIDYPLMHHTHMDSKMIPVLDSVSMQNGRGKPQDAKTVFIPLYYDEVTNHSWVMAFITKWVRHQIRVHAASIWCPLIGDVLYAKKPLNTRLHLWSIWLTSTLQLA